VKEREITDQNADLALEDSYEAIREAIDSFLIDNGFNSYSHEASIAYAYEKLELNRSETNKIDHFRKLRNDSKYRGEDITMKQSENCLELAEKLVPQLKNRFKK